tara:strand:+ start:304 stop:1431 length:1128 start_codon:yes stop_codon:yes gene_type:complete
MNNKTFIYFGSFCNTNNLRWHSSGANTKIRQTLQIAKELKYKIYFVNFTPKEISQICDKTFNITNTFNPLLYRIQILFSYIKLNRLINKKEINLIIYNASFTSLLFFISTKICNIKTKLIIQVEDLPFARKANAGIKGFLDYLSFQFLFRKASHIFFASEGMMKKAKNHYYFSCPKSLYPPTLSEDYLHFIEKRKEPFTSPIVRVMYAGAFKKEKGVFDLIESFLNANLINFQLYIYGNCNNLDLKKYNGNKSINFMGLVDAKELYKAYSLSDIIVNPHLKIINNDFIFPCKNIEILASGALPIINKYALTSFPKDLLPEKCIYRTKEDFVNLFKESKDLWINNQDQIKSFALEIRSKYRINVIKNNFAKVFNNC